ncbi:hypothetical protein FG386_001587 [Cryptosporidium ryanae]|uniref:uncharacterized protein n=1 Tax=Cryptosporidium ryanae TaxID=515981 RepID=UPI00351A5931|nr:hypothetical protein FG386_001587 [Cryptosporidium ryanae]
MIGDWVLIREYSDDMDAFLQKIGLSLVKRKVLNKGTYTLKLNYCVDEKKVKVKIEPFIGPTQTMNWDLSGVTFTEKNDEVGTWVNKLEFIKFKHIKTDNKDVLAITITRTSENFSGKIIETRWTQPDSKYGFVKYIRYRYVNVVKNYTI